jgi:fatty acid desaturase
MRRSFYDLILVLLSILSVGLTIFVMSNLDSLSGLNIFLFASAIVLLQGLNYQCIAHNFIHNPFFKSNKLNNLFSLFNSISLGTPQTLYHLHHVNHHRYNNDPIDSKNGTTRDLSSTYRYGKDGKEESWLLYSVLGIFRTDFLIYFQQAKKQGKSSIVKIEALCLSLWIILLLILNPMGFFTFYLPVWFASHIFSLMENFAEHYQASRFPYSKAVSCYNKIYNLLWFNNGFHHEHHLHPQIHWLDLPDYKSKPGTNREVKYCHIWGLFH